MTGLCALCLSVLLAAFVRLTECVGPVVRCEPCDAGALVQCKPLPHDCTERVREPGCGCCLTCALSEGQACGVYTGRCGAGMSCQQRPGESKPLQALLEGRGVCSSAPAKKLSTLLVPARRHDNPEETEEENLTNATTTTVAGGDEGIQSMATVAGGFDEGQRTVLDPKAPPLHTKLGVIQKDLTKKTQSYKVESVSVGLHTEVHNFSLESKRETEYGPCRREIESLLKSLKISSVLNPRGFRIPNCDRKGFYKKKQCRPSKGRRRGYCWCVDKYGQPLPSYDGKEQGQVHCYNLEKK
ncbi:insulin-like growth factor-binding protein 3 [Chanos chanos]|uniref:Insulin-like growth factor-binding protein 3 n=1 Tax=Chanos chanos TaxID=29144 RepID=A0A6J2V7S6_CHACN|nr:insulin-like growth factor-binding protein 3 [Chanos chanos]